MRPTSLKVTVQFETEGNGQNEILSYMERSEVELRNSEKNIMTSHVQNEILKQINFTGNGIEGTPTFFLETIFMTKL